MLGLIGVIVLVIILVFKQEKVKNLSDQLEKLKRAFEELDGQAKLIVQTDIQLHRTQEELDKKVSGLVTLQKLTRLISTTLDEEEVFKKITIQHITELGFDKAISFLVDENKTMTTKISLGYAVNEVVRVTERFKDEPEMLDKLLVKHRTVSSGDADHGAKDMPRMLHALGVASFICSPIMKKEGAVGLLLLGCESSYTKLTEGDKDVVYILTSQIGQALENAKLFEQAWRSQQELEIKIQQRTKELSEALEEIKAISKRKSDFISAVSHELRTPLTSIKGYASIIASGKLGQLPEAAKQRIIKINTHSDSLTALINNLLDISRIESGRVEMKLEPVKIKHMADGLADMLAPPMKDKEIEFVVAVPENLPPGKADKIQLERVFINLIGNAIKFTPKGGRITIEAKMLNNEMLQISVSDTGYGIAEKDIAKIFEEFYRVDNEVNQNVKGTGLGLSLVKYIVEAHKGKLSVTSQLTKGSTFTFTLPRA